MDLPRRWENLAWRRVGLLQQLREHVSPVTNNVRFLENAGSVVPLPSTYVRSTDSATTAHDYFTVCLCFFGDKQIPRIGIYLSSLIAGLQRGRAWILRRRAHHQQNHPFRGGARLIYSHFWYCIGSFWIYILFPPTLFHFASSDHRIMCTVRTRRGWSWIR